VRLAQRRKLGVKEADYSASRSSCRQIIQILWNPHASSDIRRPSEQQHARQDRLNPNTLTKAALIFLAVLAVYFFARSPRLDEFDSVNFAMGVRAFNLWDHQPHPPGYPFFIFFG
jgi:hypothetical protein